LKYSSLRAGMTVLSPSFPPDIWITTRMLSLLVSLDGIVWAIENSGAILFAYDATDLTKELYNSNQAANSRDHFSGNKFITPMVVNGKVYVGTPNSVAVFGLLP